MFSKCTGFVKTDIDVLIKLNKKFLHICNDCNDNKDNAIENKTSKNDDHLFEIKEQKKIFAQGIEKIKPNDRDRKNWPCWTEKNPKS